MYQRLQEVGSEGSDHKAKDVDHYDHCGGKLRLQIHLHADDQGHRHGQDRKEKLVVHSCQAASQSHQGMQKGEYVYCPG